MREVVPGWRPRPWPPGWPPSPGPHPPGASQTAPFRSRRYRRSVLSKSWRACTGHSCRPQMPAPEPSRPRPEGRPTGAAVSAQAMPSWETNIPACSYNGRATAPRTESVARRSVTQRMLPRLDLGCTVLREPTMSYSGEAQEKREMAARARRLAGSVTAEADRERLVRTARQLEREAQELEDQADVGAAGRTALHPGGKRNRPSLAVIFTPQDETSTSTTRSLCLSPSAPVRHASPLTEIQSRRLT